MEFTRGETPTYIVDFSTCEIDTTDVSRAVLIVKQLGIEINLTSGIVIDNESNTISYHFSQEETLRFATGKLQLQLDVVTNDEERSVASRNVVRVVDTIVDEVI